MSETLRELAENLKDIDGNVRRRAVVELSKLSGEETYPLLIEALDDIDDDVREAAIYGLVDLKNPDALEHLIKPKFLLDKNSNIQLATVRALTSLRERGGLHVISELIRLGKSPEWFIRNEAINIISREIEAIKNEGDMASIFSLLYILQLPDEEVKKKVIEVLVETGKEKEEILIKSLSSQSPQVIGGVIRVLGELKSAEAKEHLKELSSAVESNVRTEVARALGKIGGADTWPTLIKLLGDIHSDVREEAVKSVAGQGEPIVSSLIEELHHTKNKDRKKSIIEVLGEIKSEKAVIPVIDCLQDNFQFIRMASVNTLVKLKEHGVVNHLIQVLCINPIDIQPIIDTALNSNVPRLQIRAIRALGELKDTKAIEPLKNMLAKKENEILFDELSESIDKITSAIWAKICALQILGRIKSADAINVILECISEEELDIVYQAMDAIQSLKTLVGLDKIIKLADHPTDFIREKAVIILGTIGAGNSSVTDCVIKKLKDPYRDTRQEAAKTLGRLNDKKAIEPLVEMVHTCDYWSVRRDACVALENLGISKYSVDEDEISRELIMKCPYDSEKDPCKYKVMDKNCINNN